MVEKLYKNNQNFPLNFIFDYFDTKLFITRTIKEMVSGYYDPLLDIAIMYSPERINSNQFSINLNVNIFFEFLIYFCLFYIIIIVGFTNTIR